MSPKPQLLTARIILAHVAAGTALIDRRNDRYADLDPETYLQYVKRPSESVR